MQGILLAAGRGSRFGVNKLLHPLADSVPMAVAAARNLQAALSDVLAVVNDADPVLKALLEAAGLRVSVCPKARAGMGASLAWGVAQTDAADGWLIALADMPWIRPATLRAVAQAVTGPSAIAAPTYHGQRGHPVAFGSQHGPGLIALSGDEGARQILRRHAEDLILLPVDDVGVLRDIDTPGQLTAAQSPGVFRNDA